MISRFSVKKAYTVLVGVVLAIVLGVVSFMKMTTDLLPNISLPYVIVMTTYPGAGPETVESAVTQPIEASMATVSNIAGISSTSNENYSMVILEFSQTADMNAVSLEIRENLDQITSNWDESIGNPIIMKLNPDMLPVMVAAVGVEGMDYSEISTYVRETIVPGLESIEGVASVSASGLLEESVNVVIRQEKIDKINEKVFAAIDAKMEEAEKELADGKKEILDGQKELDDGKAEISKGQDELDKGKDELEKGKAELEKKKNETFAQLANTKKDLLTAKVNLESYKVSLTTNLTLVETLEEEIKKLSGSGNGGESNTPSVPEDDTESSSASSEETTESSSASSEETTEGTEGNTETEATDSGSDTESGTADEAESGVATVDEMASEGDEEGSGEESADDSASESESTAPSWPDMGDLLPGNDTLDRLEELLTQLEELTQGLDLEEYKAGVNGAIKEIDKNLVTVNNGMIELERGMMVASNEFAKAEAQMLLGELQTTQGQMELDKALEQLKAGEEQLKEALKQIEEGEKQLADSKVTAYDSADMTKIVTPEMVSGLLMAQNFSMPAGYVTEEGVDYLIRVGDKPESVEDLQSLPLLNLHMDGVPVITLADVADVFYTDNSADIYTNVDGSAGVILNIQKQTGFSTGAVSDILIERFEEMMEEDEKLSIITLMDQGIFIDLVMDSIISSVVFGFFLAVLVLIVFLKDWRPTMVIACSIPISLVTAIVCMYFSGVTLNVISLSGLALGIGMLVDNSIVVIENIYRLRSEGYSMREAAIKGSNEVAGAIMASTLTTICVFAPIVFTEGITRQLFVDMGLTIAFSLLASLFIALTVVPAMASRALTSTKEQKEGKFYKGLLNVYKKFLEWALRFKPVVFLVVIVLTIVSFLLAATNGTAFMPEMDSTQLTVNVQLGEEATLAQTGELTDTVVERLLEIEDVANVGAMSGGSGGMDLLGGGGAVNASTIYVVTHEEKQYSNEELAQMIMEKTADLDGEISVQTSNMDMSALGGSGISIQIQGRDLDRLKEIAADVAEIVAQVEGVTDVNDGMGEADEELRVIVDRNKAVDYGLTVAQVFQEVYARLATPGSATILQSADKEYSVYVMDGEDIALTRELVKELSITGTDEEGKSVEVPLSELATFETTKALSSINRSEQNRYIAVSAAIAEGYNVGLVAPEVEKALDSYKVPAGYKLVFSGENEMINEAIGQIGLMLLLALVFMYLIMVAQFQSLMSPFMIMFTIPLAFTGGFLGLFISGSEISVIALVGFVMLSGVIVNNGIVLIDYMNQLREQGMSKREAIINAGITRLRPVLMTALTTIMALITMVFGKDMGAEMGRPMAIVTIGGLTYGTLLTLIVIPCIYDCFIREKKQDEVYIFECEEQE
ncbi:MAG: efflux RND transporter permease subunit [Lachnospiraceae bacterium]|nr:efflux RND transporter permease subunit [Lachnospiraceae bacterium]